MRAIRRSKDLVVALHLAPRRSGLSGWLPAWPGWTSRRGWGVLAAIAALAAGLVAGVGPSEAAPGEPALTVDPSADLVDGQTVTITGTGLTPDTWADAAQCISSVSDIFEDCDIYGGSSGLVDADGNVTMTLRVDAILGLGFPGEEPRQADCRPAGACLIGLNAGGEILVKQISFDPDAPLVPPPTATATPDDNLVDFQTVTVEAEGLVWSDFAEIMQCSASPVSLRDCDEDTLLGFEVTGSGSLTADVEVSTLLQTVDQGAVDCRTAAGGCALVVSSDSFRSPAKAAVVPISFDPAGVVVPSALTVTPSADLVDGQTVTAAGTGFRPGAFVELLECADEAEWSSCDWLPVFARADEDGSFSTDVAVSALVRVFTGEMDEEVDCRSAAGTCFLVATTGSPGSPRAARADLHFDADAPLRPLPEITVEPSTDLPDEAVVTVSGRQFTPDGFVIVEVCQTGDLGGLCDPQTETDVTPDEHGELTVELDVAATFESWDGEPVDCREAPGCEVIAYDYSRERGASAPLSFATSPGGDGDRYLDPVFDEIEVTEDVVFGEAMDSQGNMVELTADIYQPAGDTEDMRPAVVWFEGGWFGPGGDEEQPADMAAYADAFARRGYVAVTMEYRQRPELECCPATDPVGVTEALLDGHEDAMAGIEWLHERAADYRIDTRAIAAGGAEAGAANAFSLAYHPAEGGGPHDPGDPGDPHDPHLAAAPSDMGGDGDDMGDDEPLIAAALPIAGVSLGHPAEGTPPVLAFHGADDRTAPLHLSEWTCADAAEVGAHCETVGFDGGFGNVASTRQRDIVRRSADFLAEMVLGPLGYLDPDEQPTSTTTSTPTSTTTAVTTTGRPGGNLPRTGADGALAMVRIGALLALAGAGLVGAARWRRNRLATAGGAAHLLRRRGRDQGRLTVVGVVSLAATAGALFVAMTLPHERPSARPEANAGDGGGTAGALAPLSLAQEGDGSTTTTDTSVPDPAGTTTTTTTTVDGTTTTTVDGSTTSTTTTLPVDAEAEEDPGHDFPDDWTPEQVAFATELIHETEMALPRYANPAILPLLGYVWILDGVEPGDYQHWVSLGRFDSQHLLDPDDPESLVFRITEDGRVLEAAMFILPFGYTLDNIPEDIAFLPGWHVHDNLCFDGNGRVVDIAEDGVCERGSLLITPPMVHVWLVDTPCGRFAGVDENGLICHDHED